MQRDTKPYNIVVVEDNPGDFLLVQDYLEEEIHLPIIQLAESFNAVAPLLEQGPSSIDVILLDLTLPDKQGEDLVNSMVTLAKGIPVIILTGYADIHFSIRALALGASDYLLKENLSALALYKSIVYNIERNRNLVRLKESEQRYSNLFHLSPQPMWVFELDSLGFLDVNKAAIQHYGYSREEFLKMSLPEIKLEQEVVYMEKTLNPLRSDRASSMQAEYRHLKKNGEEIIVDVRSNKIVYDGKNAVVSLATDITERNRHVQAIEDQNKKLKEIAWTQSHIVRAPLARIMGLINTIGNNSSTMEEKEVILQYIMDSSRELDTIIQEIVSKSG
jgi:PAS domain S-box-containing protein